MENSQGERVTRQELFFIQPARQWTEAFPLGNGRLGAMVFGKIDNERIQLNEDSLWFGGPRDRLNPDGCTTFDQVKALLAQGNLLQAQRLARAGMLSTPQRQNAYQPLADLEISFEEPPGEVTHYRRSLDLQTAEATITYRRNDTRYTRHLFCSFPDRVLVIYLEASVPHTLALTARFSRRGCEEYSRKLGVDTVYMAGQSGPQGVLFAAVLTATQDEGSLTTLGDSIIIEDATTALLIVTAATSFRFPNPLAEAAQCGRRALHRGYVRLRETHRADIQPLLTRTTLELEDDHQKDALPTDERVRLVQKDRRDIALEALLFHFGRYALLASSRPGSLPANLQGIWNEQMTPPWESKYTININLEMNYWLAGPTNLIECQLPLFDLISRLAQAGEDVAQRLYGCSGWVAHHNTDLWADAAPVDGDPGVGLWPLGGCWLALHLWEHYRFTADDRFLRHRAFPLLLGAAQFLCDYLWEHPSGYRVTGPSCSPENRYKTPDGHTLCLCVGSTHDSQLVRELFTTVLEAAAILGNESPLLSRIRQILPLLPPTRLTSDGRIAEWLDDFQEADPGHRHLSHLFALHPGTQIDRHRDPEQAAAVYKTLSRRLEHGSGHTGWSRAWMINLFARLGDGSATDRHITEFLRLSLLPNLFGTHPPFQIDGNFGYSAGIAECLLQSHTDQIELLPALPRGWHNGSVRGLLARGGHVVDITWQNGQLTSATITPYRAEALHVRSGQGQRLTVKKLYGPRAQRNISLGWLHHLGSDQRSTLYTNPSLKTTPLYAETENNNVTKAGPLELAFPHSRSRDDRRQARSHHLGR